MLVVNAGLRREDPEPLELGRDPELLAELRAWAANDLRSLNGQIEFLLRDALKRRKGGR